LRSPFKFAVLGFCAFIVPHFAQSVKT
jgi:hypothetical protein